MAPRSALVTRCTQSAISRAIAIQLADDGFNIAISDDPSQQSALVSLQREIESKGVQCHSYICDLSKESDIEGLVKHAAKDLGGVDVVYLSPTVALTRLK